MDDAPYTFKMGDGQAVMKCLLPHMHQGRDSCMMQSVGRLLVTLQNLDHVLVLDKEGLVMFYGLAI